MKIKDLIAKLKKCQQEAEVYFDDLDGGLIPIDDFKIVSRSKARELGSNSKTTIVVLSD